MRGSSCGNGCTCDFESCCYSALHHQSYRCRLENEVRSLASSYWSVASLLHHAKGDVLACTMRAFKEGTRLDVSLESLLKNSITNPIFHGVNPSQNSEPKVCSRF